MNRRWYIRRPLKDLDNELAHLIRLKYEAGGLTDEERARVEKRLKAVRHQLKNRGKKGEAP